MILAHGPIVPSGTHEIRSAVAGPRVKTNTSLPVARSCDTSGVPRNPVPPATTILMRITRQRMTAT